MWWRAFHRVQGTTAEGNLTEEEAKLK